MNWKEIEYYRNCQLTFNSLNQKYISQSLTHSGCFIAILFCKVLKKLKIRSEKYCKTIIFFLIMLNVFILLTFRSILLLFS